MPLRGAGHVFEQQMEKPPCQTAQPQENMAAEYHHLSVCIGADIRICREKDQAPSDESGHVSRQANGN